MSAEIKWEMREVPPPPEAPLHGLAISLGLIECLRVVKESGGRCGNCRHIIHDYLVWVPDGVMLHDSSAEVREQARLIAFNGNLTGWCVGCAKKLGRDEIRSAPEVAFTTPRTWWKFWKWPI